MLTSKLGHQGDSQPVAISGGNRVAVMQPTESRQRDNFFAIGGRRRSNSTTGRVLPQSEMSSVFVVIADILFQQPSQVSLVQNDHMIQQSRRTLPTQRSAMPFCQGLRNAVRTGSAPWCLTVETTSAQNFESRSKIMKRCGCCRIPMSRAAAARSTKRLVAGHVAVQDLPTVMADDEKAIQDPEGQCRHSEEVHRCDRLAMVAEKCQPALGRIRILGARLTHRDTVRSEMSKPSLSSSPWMRGAPHVGFSATIRKISSRTSLLIGLLPTSCVGSRNPSPIQPKACTMPANDRLRGNQDQWSLPARPNSSQNDPEQLVDGTQSRTRSLGVESQQLLPKSEVFQDEFFSGAKGRDNPAEQMSKAHQHQVIIAKSSPRRFG